MRASLIGPSCPPPRNSSCFLRFSGRRGPESYFAYHRRHGEVAGVSPLSHAVLDSVVTLTLSYGPILVGGGAIRRGRQMVLALPAMIAGWGLGFLTLGPYVALRNYTPEGDGEDPGLVEVLCLWVWLTVGVIDYMQRDR